MDKETRKLVSTHKDADRSINALLMRADIHDLFDDYQFGYMRAVSLQFNAPPSNPFKKNKLPLAS
jgi:hypothetical protein